MAWTTVHLTDNLDMLRLETIRQRNLSTINVRLLKKDELLLSFVVLDTELVEFAHLLIKEYGT